MRLRSESRRGPASSSDRARLGHNTLFLLPFGGAGVCIAAPPIDATGDV
jgi:hypothetical protein